MRLQIYLVESCTRLLMSILCMVFPLCILYAFWLSVTCSFVVCHSFGDIWLVEQTTMRYIFVTGTLQPLYVRYMYVRHFGYSTGLTFLPPDNKNSYPFHVRRFNPVKCDRGLRDFGKNYGNIPKNWRFKQIYSSRTLMSYGKLWYYGKNYGTIPKTMVIYRKLWNFDLLWKKIMVLGKKL